MAIGWLSFGVAVVCAVVALVGSITSQTAPRREAADYRRIYADMMPREISGEVTT